MRSNTSNAFVSKSLLATRVVALSFALATIAHAAPQPAQKTFSTPQEAAAALIQAATDYDVPALMGIFGPDGEPLISSADPVRDKNAAIAFAAKAKEKNSVAIDPRDSKRAILSVGDESWPVPTPIVEKNGKWSFDAKDGLEEVLLRRIGGNELDAITICRGYVEAQKEYAEQVHDGSGVNQYAQRIVSTPGKQDGLAWKNADGSWGGPVGEAVANALQEGYVDKTQPFHGYYFKVLKGQGPAAPLGKLDFVVGGAMIGGFALVAVPAEYRVTGVKTFIVSYEGVVYQKDLGSDSLNIIKKMELYDPDKGWQATVDDEQ